MNLKIIEINNTEQKITIDSAADNQDILIIGKDGGNINIDLNLNKSDTNGHIYAILVGRENQEYNITINSNHEKELTNSRVHVKAVMMDSSKLNFDGMIKITPNSQQADAYLQNDNLLIGDNAIVNSSPQLEIGADDVKASHGVTITNIEETEKFYLMARGISEQQAEQLVVYGFINEFIELIEDEEEKEKYKLELLN